VRTKPFFFAPQWLFLLIGLIAGGLLCVFIPYGAGFDEETHLARVYDLANKNILPNHATPRSPWVYPEFFKLSYQRRVFQTPAWDLLTPPLVRMTTGTGEPMEVYTRSIYNPVIFTPQVLVIYLGWLANNLPFIPVVIAARLAGLFLYLGIGFWAVRLVPIGKWVLVVLGLAPMALFQAGTLNADGFTIAVSFLFIALALRMYERANDTVRARDVWGTAGAALLLGLAKPGAILILPLLLFFPARRFRRRRVALVLWGAAVLAILATIGWSAIAVSNSHFSAGGDQSVGRQLDLVLAQPSDFILTFLGGVLSALPAYAADWIGVYGHWIGTVPGLVYPFFILALIFALAADSGVSVRWFTLRIRLLSLGVFLFSSAVILLMYFYANYAPGDASSLGKQGRYFLPMAPLLFIPLAGLVDLTAFRRNLAFSGVIAGLALALGWYGYGLYATYYTFCGEMIYTGKACVQPVYKHLEKQDTPSVSLHEDTVVRQRFENTCERLVGAEALIASMPDTRVGKFDLQLKDPQGNLVGRMGVDFTRVEAGNYLRLKMEGITLGDGGVYAFEIRAPEIEGIELPALAYVAGDFYGGGDLAVDDALVDGDLVFHYICDLPGRAGAR
jgi:uncharacterized membrane protein